MLSWHPVALVLALALSPQVSDPVPFDCVVTTSPHPVRVVQPDGTALLLHFRGNGLNAWYEDAAGYPVVERDGWFVYARTDADRRLQPTELRVGRDAPAEAGLEPHVRPALTEAARRLRPQPGKAGGHGASGAFLGSSSVKNLVILVMFSNHGPGGQNRTLPSPADVDVIMNAPGGDPTLAPTGSVNDHYQEMSYGQFSIDSTVAAWVTAPNTEVYYANGNSGLTSLTWDLIESALELVDPSIDFGDFDENGDGVIDAITFLHSGYGAEWGGIDQYGTHYANRMWSHKWGIPTWTSDEGVTVSAYHISPALWATSGSNPGRIGVVSHESGHFFGLPDLYDTDGSSEGDGNWCLMAAGSWGFDSSQHYPTHMSPWSKSKLGWIAPQRILPGAHVAPRVETSPTVFMIDSGYPPGEYLMIENRQPTGFDSVIPQGGLAIWHVDEAKGGLGSNWPNGDEGYPGQSGWPGNGRHYRNALLQADDDYDLEHGSNRGDGGDIYHGAGVSVIDGGTSPGTNAYQEGNILSSGNRIDSIGLSSANVAFDYSNSLAPSITSGAPPTGSTSVPYSFNLTSAGGTAPRVWWETIESPTYLQQDLGSSLFAGGGTAQGWSADDATWELPLPFLFPFYERRYDRVYVSSNGFLDFAPGEADPSSTKLYLRAETRISPLWDDLRTDDTDYDIYVDTSLSDRIRVRWDARTFAGNLPVNIAVTLFDDGRIRFDYGTGNTGIFPVVGISRGQAGLYQLVPGYDGASSLGSANSILFTLQGSEMPPGLSLSSGGGITGTPTMDGTWQPWVRVTDAQHRYDETQLTITIGNDCNGNGTDDADDISSGTSQDCNSNGTPDECEPDCDADGVPDDCETDCNANGTPDDCESFPDCNSNGIPDECEPDCDTDGIPDDCEADCNSNGTPDDCESFPDCNSNGIPDECEPDCDADGIPDDCETDCNSNGTPDECESFPDCNSNGIPDECEPDCDADGIPDDCETDCNSNGTPDDCESFPDCNSNGIPDECEPDCDADGIPDDCEADCDADGIPDDCEADCDADGIPDDCEADCDADGIPDDCEADCDSDGIPDDCEADCNANGTPDDCESATDCNGNGVPDECDITSGASSDLDGNGVPDECQVFEICHAKPNSVGCLPSIGFTGLPTLSGQDDFVVVADKVIGAAPGTLVWSVRTNGSFGGGIRPIGGSPLGGRGCLVGGRVLASQTAGGTPGTCGGAFAFTVSQADMAGAGLAAGMTAYAQIWYADPGHPDGTGVGHTGALAFPVLP